MKLTRRERREWRMVLWIGVGSAVISGYFGFAIAPEDEHPVRAILLGVMTSLLIATPISIIEARRAHGGFLRPLRRLPLALYFAIKVAFYLVVIVFGLVMSRWIAAWTADREISLDAVFGSSLVFAVAMSVLGNLIFEVGGLLGFGTLKNLLTGRYVQPRREQRVFLLIDMRNSTGLAERLGPVRFHELLNWFFRDISDAALECDAEIHKYVGDEAILTWPTDRVLAEGACLACPFILQDIIARNRDQYRSRFGVVPVFRAAVHGGEIVAGEIGDVRREIAYVGDTLNTTARLLDAAKAAGQDVLVSADLLQQVHLPSELRALRLPTLEVRGRSAPLGIAVLQRSASGGEALDQAAQNSLGQEDDEQHQKHPVD
ncbi:MAG: adenylate/guanylate cyclase domain-containing protein [Reyranella sp.]|uniref:adenylate/guanylate cyclase domain-containing protein n=1 Tax=Reyranella sp. TaxID=1929291 RepID=UPI003D14DDFC